MSSGNTNTSIRERTEQRKQARKDAVEKAKNDLRDVYLGIEFKHGDKLFPHYIISMIQ